MTLGRGLAVAGIWLGVGLVGLADTSGWSAAVSLFALFGTFLVLAFRE
jgi:hypothetical protein